MRWPELPGKSRQFENWSLPTVAFAAIAFLASPTTFAQASKDSAPKPSAAKPEPERGYAAFYSPSLEGHKTACGGTYSSDKFTAAHPRLPCGTKLRITNLRNGKTVRVTVNDHGPTSSHRIIDLSYAAARSLNFIKQGTTLVKVEVLR
jgi:rare lipoprotein A